MRLKVLYLPVFFGDFFPDRALCRGRRVGDMLSDARRVLSDACCEDERVESLQRQEHGADRRTESVQIDFEGKFCFGIRGGKDRTHIAREF